MKPLSILGVAVAVLLMGWWLFSGPRGGRGGYMPLSLPTNPDDQAALIRSSHQLWKTTPTFYEPFECSKFIQLLAERVSEENWRAVSAPVFYGWDKIRDVTEARPRLIVLEAVLIPRLLRAGSTGELEGLVRIANTHSFDRELLEAELDKAIKAPLPPEGYFLSRQEQLVAAAVRAEDFVRARRYVAAVVWPDASVVEMKEVLKDLNDAIALCIRGREGDLEIPAVVRAWSKQGRSEVQRSALRPALEGLAVNGIWGEPRPGRPRSVELLGQSLKEPGAEAFWERILTTCCSMLLQAGGSKIEEVAELVAAFGRGENKADYAHQFWMRAGHLQARMTPEDALRPVLFFERARAAATSEAGTLAAAGEIIAGNVKAMQFTRARMVAEESLKSAKDEAQRKTLAEKVEKIKALEREDIVKQLAQERDMDREVRKGRLQAMKDKLATAQRFGRPESEIKAIREEIKNLEKPLTD